INYKVKPDWGGTNDLVEIGVMGGLGRKWDPAKFLQRGTPKMAARPYVMFQQGDMAEVDDRAEDVVDKALGIGADTRSSTLREVMRTR
ncbi:MAG: hypothetical protein U9Q07_05605, partial [Planctomycetota bacterium]|nr:hypothetical protein [Planctomycetota bacterium]